MISSSLFYPYKIKKLKLKRISKLTIGSSYILQRYWSPGNVTAQTVLYSLPLEDKDEFFISTERKNC